MPLSEPVPREALHTRTIDCHGYARDDGLWDIEAHMIDTKSYSFPNQDRGGEIKAGEPLHEMWLRMTVSDDLTIHSLEAVTDHAPFDVCPQITDRFQQLVGMQIGRGWNRKVKELLGGVRGCTHLVELLGPVATTAFQTLQRKRHAEAVRPDLEERPVILNTCHALADDGEVVARLWPQFHRREKGDSE